MPWQPAAIRRHGLLTVAVVALATGTAGGAPAAWIESAVMPGKVTAKHAETEKQCRKCHEPFAKAAQDGLCRDCHTDVGTDLDQGRGFHGRNSAVRGVQCRSCHTEHEGRDFDIVRLERQDFDHRLTDLLLRGAHTRATCDGCHVDGVRWRDTPAECNACHRGTREPHEGALGENCRACHDEEAWTPASFDHQTSAFPLLGRHRDSRCESCHVSRRYASTPTQCVACHARNDKHQGSFTADCAACHTPRAWTGVSFDHARKTRFALSGRHSKVACSACHKPGVPAAGTALTCVACHSRDDAHQGILGTACESCHDPNDWRRPTFDHARDADYALRGRHRDTACTLCHRSLPRHERLSTLCYDCHRDDDVHQLQQGKRCDSCHDESSWSRHVLFDHDTTKFALTNAHSRLVCTQCHRAKSYGDVGRECHDCHKNDTAPCATQGKECKTCHDTSTFRSLRAPRR